MFRNVSSFFLSVFSYGQKWYYAKRTSWRQCLKQVFEEHMWKKLAGRFLSVAFLDWSNNYQFWNTEISSKYQFWNTKSVANTNLKVHKSTGNTNLKIQKSVAGVWGVLKAPHVDEVSLPLSVKRSSWDQMWCISVKIYIIQSGFCL